MANALIISKQTGGYFSFNLSIDGVPQEEVRSIQNDLLTVGNTLHFKTSNGANIIKQQDIVPAELTIIASGTFTFATVTQVWDKLIEVGFFDWLGTGGGAGVNRFDDLLDTFQYFGKDGYVCVVNESQQKLEAVPFYNYRKFTDLEDSPSFLVPNKMVVVNPAGNALILQDQPASPDTYLNSVGYFDYNDSVTHTTPLTFVASTPKKLTNDTLGVNTNTSQNPYGVSYVWNSTTNQFDFSQLSIGDTLDIRIQVQVTTTTANQKFKITGKFGIGSVAQFENTILSSQVKTAGLEEISFVAPFYIGSTYIRDFPAELYLTSDNGGTVVVDGWYVRILRKNINIITIESTVPDATTLVKGIVRLGGDLSGTSDNPTVPALATKQNTSTVTDFDKAYVAPYTTENIRNSEADIVVLNSGNYLTAYTKFGRVATDFSPSSIVCKISTNSTGTEWSDEIVVSPNIGAQNVMSVSLIRIDVSTIHCFFLVRNSFTDLELNRVVSTDEGLTWGSPSVITSNGYTDILNASVKRVNSNRILISAESTPDGSVGSPTWDIFTYYSDDNGATYTKSNIVHVATSEGETSVCWLGGNDVLISTRSTDGFQWFTKSTNNGTTWGTPYQSTLKSTAAPAQIINYSGTLIALHNSNTVDDIRNPLTISKSLDGGDTWVEVDNLNLPRESYYRYAYPSITLDGDYMLITYYEISGDAGVGLKFSKINIPNLLTGVKPEKSSPDELYLYGLTFDKSQTIQPQDDVLTAFGKIQSQINKKEGEAFTYKGVGAGIIFQNDQPDNVMDLQFMDFKNTDGSLVSRIGHIGSSEKLYFLSDKTIRVDSPLFEVNAPTNITGLLTVERSGFQAYFKGSDQGAFDMEKTGGYKIRMFVDANNFGLYNFNNGLVPFEISNTTAIVNFSQIPTAPTAAAGNNTTQIATTAFVQANKNKLVGYTVATLPAGTIGDMAYVTDALAPTYNGVLTGGGAVKIPVFYNGTAWTAH